MALGYKYCISEDFEVMMARALLCSRLQLAELERGRPTLLEEKIIFFPLNNRRFYGFCDPEQRISGPVVVRNFRIPSPFMMIAADCRPG